MIREAFQSDLGALIALARQFDAASQYGEWDAFTGSVVQDMLQDMLDDPMSRIFVTDDRQAAIGVTLAPSLKSGALMRLERFWYADPSKRGVGMRLYRAADAWATAQGAEIRSLVCPWKAPEVRALYERMGYEPVEITWVKR